MVPSAPLGEREWHARVTEVRNRLAGLCLQIAEVEGHVAATFSEIARTATDERAARLRILASAARDYAAQERSRAQEYSGSPAAHVD